MSSRTEKGHLFYEMGNRSILGLRENSLYCPRKKLQEYRLARYIGMVGHGWRNLSLNSHLGTSKWTMAIDISSEYYNSKQEK
jgi:hypothetical protein